MRYEELGRISVYIIKSTKKQTKKSNKKSLIDYHSKRLLGFKSNHSIKPKCLKWVVEKILQTIWKTHNQK